MSPSRPGSLLAAPLWALAWLAGGALVLPYGITGCSADDVVVAELPVGEGAGGSGGEGGASGAGGSGGGSCTSPDDCGPFSYCEKPGPLAEGGECKPRPVTCESSYEEVCGCDGVTYWNDCLRQQLGVPCARKGRCQQEASLCGGPAHAACPVAGASCARLFPPGSICPPDAPGQCWFLPPICPTPQSPPTFGPCGPMMGPGPCLDPCEAIRSELPHMLYPGPTCKKGM